MMAPADGYRRRATDTHWLYRVWVALPLVDRQTGEWSITRTLAAYFALRTGLLIDAVTANPAHATWAMGALITANVLATMACAFGKRVFEAVALRIAGARPGSAAEPGVS